MLMTRKEIIDALEGVPKQGDLEIALCAMRNAWKRGYRAYDFDRAVDALIRHYRDKVAENLEKQRLTRKEDSTTYYSDRAEVYRQRLEKVRRITGRNGAVFDSAESKIRGLAKGPD